MGTVAVFVCVGTVSALVLLRLQYYPLKKQFNMYKSSLPIHFNDKDNYRKLIAIARFIETSNKENENYVEFT